MPPEIRLSLYIARFAPSRSRLIEYARRKNIENPDSLLTEIGYNELTMLTLWLESYLSTHTPQAKIRTKLLMKRFPKDMIDEALESREDRLHDWSEYEWTLVRRVETLQHRGKSLQYIRSDILHDFPQFREEIDSLLEDQDDRDTIRRDFQKKYGSLIPSDPREKQKMIAFFLRKGYKYGMIWELIARDSQI